MTSHSSSVSLDNPGSDNNRDRVVLQGYHKKLKTMKKKYFVLYSENGIKSARLEYYDSEKKFKSRSNPKRVIILKNCFNINRRLDTKHDNVIALSTKEEVFCIVLETEDELNQWLQELLRLQRGEDMKSDPPKPYFEHVWQVQVQRKGLAEEKGILGKYYVLLTTKSVTLDRIGSSQTTQGENRLSKVEFYLTTIRRCGNSQCFFLLEVGRHSAIGAGQLWMQTEDLLIAQNMHETIVRAMSSIKNFDDGFGPISRKRSSSANEASKPISMLYRRQTHSGTKPMNSSPLSESPNATASTISSTCTIIENPIIKPSTSKALETAGQTGVSTNSLNSSSTISQQPDSFNSQQSAISSCSTTRIIPVITSTSCNPHYPFTAPLRTLGSQRRHSVSGIALGRERCDSLPSRNRTASECSNNQTVTNSSMPPPSRPIQSARPHSMYTNRHSHSPPLNTLSPSTGCSESDGSSLSVDESDSSMHPMTPDESGNYSGRFYNSHSHSGGVIPEENCDDTWYLDKSSVRMLDNLNNANGRLTLPISTAHNIHNMRKSSPATSQVSSADIQSQYIDMFSPYSPPGSSPCDQVGSGFMPVSPSTEYPRGLYTGSSGGHSRASSLAEETVDGYVPMCPPQIQDYVDMEQSSKHHTSGMSSAASSCSITSGTPSTDIRFAEYPLDKVKSRFTPDDEDLYSINERPIRAYSVGSRPEHIKRKLRVEALSNQADENNSRVRAFSVGSRAKVPRCDLHRGVFAPSLMSCYANNNNINNNISDIIAVNSKGKKSSSAPILVHKSQSSVDRMSDLMEIDFSKNSENHSSSSTNSNSGSGHSQQTARFTSFPLSVPNAQHQQQQPQKRDFIENSPKANSGYLEMKPGSYTDKSSPTGPKPNNEGSGYLEMRPIGVTMKNSGLSSSPIKASSSVPKSIASVTEESNYLNMSPGASSLSHRMEEDYMNIDPHARHMEVDCPTTPEGQDTVDYDGRIGHDSRNASSPIDIKIRDKKADAFAIMRNRSDPRDAIIPIASHPNTIFPFSLGSPAKGFNEGNLALRKCYVDATSGTVTLSENQSSGVDNPVFAGLSNLEKRKITASDATKILNTDVKAPIAIVDELSNDYADMSLGSSNKDRLNANTALHSTGSDYVNYIPPTEAATARATAASVTKKPNKKELEHDYAIMSKKNVTSSAKKIKPQVTTSSAFSNKKPSVITVTCGERSNSSNFAGFKPITPSSDEWSNMRQKNQSRYVMPANLNCQFSEQRSATADDNYCTSSGYELLQMRSDSSLQTKKNLSRPNSVNSEKISPSKTIAAAIVNRPNSANSECIQSISTSSSTSTLCGSSSSSSTLCGSKSQSPLTSSQSQSLGDPSSTAMVATSSVATNTSRPESVSSITDPMVSSRPPSVSSERELHYASLDLPPASNNLILSPSSSTNADCCNSSNNSLAKNNSSSASGESSTSPSPNASGSQQQPSFTYAQIDFIKSENLKKTMNAAAPAIVAIAGSTTSATTGNQNC